MIPSAAARCTIAALAVCALCPTANAQTWPDRPVKLIVNFPPGGVADTLARGIAPGIQEAIKQPVVVENRAVANGSIGADVVAKAPPAGVSPAIVERMNKEITRTLNSPALVESMAKLGGDVAPMTISEFVSRQAADRARYGAFIKEAGIKVE